jgi:L-threonylcarbamoyladenylate synthase
MASLRKTRILPIDPCSPEEQTIGEATQLLDRGGLVAFPTDTLYGLGADATSPSAVEAVFRAKERPPNKPLIVLARDLAMVNNLVEGIDEKARLLMNRFWPGPLTLVLPASPRLPSSLTGNTGRIGVRIPRSPIALALLRAVSFPLTAPSANRSGGRDPLSAQMVWEELGGRIDLVLDGGPVGGIPSTILDLTSHPPRLIREGAISLQALIPLIPELLSP